MARSFHPSGPPAFKIAGLTVWVFGRQFEGQYDYWDGNWLRVRAHCEAQGAEVRAEGAILHLSEIARWLDELKSLHANLTGTAELGCTEPNLHAKIELKDGRGQIAVRLTPDHPTQQHHFDFEVDQSHFPSLIAALERLLDEYPIRDPQPEL